MEEEFTEVLEAFREFRSVITCDDWDRYCEVARARHAAEPAGRPQRAPAELSQRTKALAGSANSAMEP